MRIETRSARAVRVRAAAPRLLLTGFVLLLCIRGLATIVSPPSDATAVAPPPPAMPSEMSVASFAEGFTRAYLTWDAGNAQRRDKRLAAYISDDVDAGAGLVPPPDGSQAVAWTAAVATARQEGDTVVTVAADTGSRIVHLAVPVHRTTSGALAVRRHPAITGPPLTDRSVDAPVGDSVEDGALSQVVSRSITNFVTGARQNLMADLLPGSVVSLPGTALRSPEIGAITWVQPDQQVAVEVTVVDADDERLTLRYALDVSHRERWYVRSIATDPRTQGVQP